MLSPPAPAGHDQGTFLPHIDHGDNPKKCDRCYYEQFFLGLRYKILVLAGEEEP